MKKEVAIVLMMMLLVLNGVFAISFYKFFWLNGIAVAATCMSLYAD